jgi:uncharacterized damage-inducible protein DinB
LVRDSRQVIFQFLETQVKEHISTPLAAFNNKTICYMYLHIANTYIAWAGNFALRELTAYYDQDRPVSLGELRDVYEGVDVIMQRFTDHFSLQPGKPVKGFKWPEKYIETDALGIFTHVLTHEFHHKGQAMTMARLLGHIPPDTDVLRF